MAGFHGYMGWLPWCPIQHFLSTNALKNMYQMKMNIWQSQMLACFFFLLGFSDPVTLGAVDSLVCLSVWLVGFGLVWFGWLVGCSGKWCCDFQVGNSTLVRVASSSASWYLGEGYTTFVESLCHHRAGRHQRHNPWWRWFKPGLCLLWTGENSSGSSNEHLRVIWWEAGKWGGGWNF